MKQLTENQQKELNKYIDVYTKGTTHTPGVYGHNNWGSGVYGYIQSINPNSLLDIGCGQGVFINDMDIFLKIPKLYALDIASVKLGKHINNKNVTWLDSQAHDIPLEENSVEYITSFDCLEHVLEEDVDTIVNEFYRVSTKGLILKIAYHQARERARNGEVLHMTVQSEQWWIEKFENKFQFKENFNGYLIFTK